VEQTVDDVVIITNGKLVSQGAMTDLHGEPRALVRTSDAAALAGALRVADVTSTEDGTGALVADTADLRLIGDVALRAGLPVYELHGIQNDLEQLFFALTENTNRNLGQPAPSERDAIAAQEGANG
jgi:ABC-2 type transport system ATP-binding protein